jgi:hypothetical protein
VRRAPPWRAHVPPGKCSRAAEAESSSRLFMLAMQS